MGDAWQTQVGLCLCTPGEGWDRAGAHCLMLLPFLLQDTVVVGNELHGLKVKHLHVGGVLGSGEVQNGLRGCIQVSPLL